MRSHAATPPLAGLALLLLLAPTVVADEVEDAADALLAAHRAGDAEAMASIAAAESPEPSAVAKVLVSRGENDAVKGLVGALMKRGIDLQRPGAEGDALRAFGEALAVVRLLEDPRGEMVVRHNRGGFLHRLGRSEEALTDFTAALGIAKSADDALSVGRVLAMIGECRLALHDGEGAERALVEAAETFEGIGQKPRAASALMRLGVVLYETGRYAEARTELERSIRIAESIGHEMILASALNSLGTVLDGLGEYPAAIRAYERAQKLNTKMDYPIGRLIVLGNLGGLLMTLGDPERALHHMKEAAAIAEKLGVPDYRHSTLVNLGNAYDVLGDRETALEHYRKSLEVIGDSPPPRAKLMVAGNIGLVLAAQGKQEEALAKYDEAIRIAAGIGDPDSEALNTLNAGVALRRLGRLDEARARFDAGLEAYTALGNADGRSRALFGRATVDVERGDHVAALARLTEAVDGMSMSFRGLGDEQGARARDLWRGAVDLGIRVSAHLKDADSIVHFMERGRAASLLESLGATDPLRRRLLPEEIRREEAEARSVMALAEARLGGAIEAGNRKAIAEARGAVDAAREDVEAVVARIQRKTRARGSVLLPKLDDLGTIRGRLAEGDALVLYAVMDEKSVALVLGGKEPRIVDLPDGDRVRAAVAKLLVDEAPFVDPAAAEELRKMVVGPLDLDEGARRVLVSPDGILGYVPFSLLMPERVVAYVPSGTVHGLVSEARAPATDGDVLALGDPSYESMGPVAMRAGSRFSRLVPLPQTRLEVSTVGTIKLLGKAATVERLVETIQTRDRWRAVHLACHGLLDPDRPLFSALALSPGKHDDGFLLCLDVLDMDVPADLVVLSACETGKGRIYRSEGIVGLTRAFMVAGAARVLCSLWKVDDEATRALMVKFYELWNPDEGEGLPAAEALRKAQDHVRGHEKWKHPHFWAAWVLWGLPD